ncbi:MAG: amino acid adenylation domain-containing protein [Lachnospiraceae bacterium]|jgi:amino acid adenylation domain-containing protein
MSKTIFDKNLIYGDNRYEACRNYWDSIVTNGVGTVDLSFPQKGKTGEDIISVEKCTISAEAAAYIRKTAKGNLMGMFAIMLSAFKVINYKCSTKESTVISYLSPSLAGIKDVDYVILQSTISESETLKDTITKTARAVAAVYKYQDYPLSLVDDRFAKAGFDITELINVGFSFRGLHNDFTQNGRPDIYFQIVDISESSLEISLAANTKFIDAQDAAILLHNYVSFLDRIAVLMNQTIADIRLTDDAQSAFMRKQFTADNLKAYTVRELFEKVALDYREKTAVVFGNSSLTYNQLNSRANCLAVDMTEHGFTSGDRVLILMEMSIYVPIAMLACIKLGVPYIPLDVDTPSDRISYIIEDSEAKFVISSQSQNDFLSQFSIKVFEIECYEQMNEITNPKVELNSNSPLYIIYTSGTTGKPKGVVVNNRNMVNYVNWFTLFARVTDRDKAMLVSSFSFDLGYTSVYSSLLNGAELHLLSKEQYSNVPYMLGYIDKQSVTFFKLTPSLFSLLKTDSNFINYNLSSLRLVILGGEKLRIDDIKGFKESYKNCEFVNHYGPTETTVGTIAKYISESEYTTFEQHSILGKAITNNEVYILNSSNEIMPVGILGEIVVGGLGVSDGYLHRKELNAEKFITLPELSKSVLYKTGDLGRLLPTGEFEFFGRIDNQVKIRGYRVELDEVKQAIKKYEGITDVVITTYSRNNNISLCAYYVSDRDIVAKLLREYLSIQLPDYMIPTYFTSIAKIPITLNGKIDFKALPEPSIDLSDREIVLPRNDTEKRLAMVWQDVLGISENLSIDDNFFDLGGDSILAIQMSSTAKSEGLNIEVKDIMQNPTIRQLGAITKVDMGKNVISQEPIMGEVQLSPIQKRFFERLGALNHWNQSIVLHSKTPVDTYILRNAFEILLERHDMLRAVYTEADHGFEQSVGNLQDKESMYRFMVINVETEITSTIIEEKGNELQNSLDIANGLIAVFAVIQNSKEQYILMIIHHLVVDGVSWRIIVSDFDAICQGGIDKLPLKTNTYRDWVNWMKDNEIRFRKDTDYWNSMPEIAGMTDNYPSKNGFYKDTRTQSIMIDVDTTKAILSTANHAYNTKTDELLITAF